MVMQTYQRAFTLIELMIVVAVIAILAAIAYPSYQESVRKTKRTDAKADMMVLAHNLQRFKIANFSFSPGGTDVTLSDVGSNGNIPATDMALYTVDLSIGTNARTGGGSTWTLTATPISGTTQANDGTLILNNQGEKCWTKNGCTDATSSSSWD